MAIEMSTGPAHVVSLSEPEIMEMSQILESVLGELRVEIRHTRAIAYHDQLIARESVLRGLIEKLRAALE